MSDMMLHAVLNMPVELWSDSPIDQMQRHSRYVAASAEITRLQAENNKLDVALKLVQGHAKAALDRCIFKWNEGHIAGMKSAGMEYEKVHEIFKQLKKERADDNASFTEEIMRIEAENSALTAELANYKEAELNEKLGMKKEG